jgi:O-antigen ligase
VITAAAAVVLYLLIMKVPVFYEIAGVRFEGAFALFGNSGEVDGSTRVRLQMIEAAWEGWLDSPLWGHGFDSFKYYNARSVTGHLYYSHNNFVELLYNQGIIGFVAYYFMYGYILIKALKYKGRSLSKGFALAVVVSLMPFEYFAVTYSATPIQIMIFFAYLKMREVTEGQECDKIGD